MRRSVIDSMLFSIWSLGVDITVNRETILASMLAGHGAGDPQPERRAAFNNMTGIYPHRRDIGGHTE